MHQTVALRYENALRRSAHASPTKLQFGPRSSHKNRASDSRGFSLIELLIVVAIILIIAAIAIPNFLRARIAANEAAAANNTRTITTAADNLLLDLPKRLSQCTLATMGHRQAVQLLATQPI